MKRHSKFYGDKPAVSRKTKTRLLTERELQEWRERLAKIAAGGKRYQYQGTL